MLTGNSNDVSEVASKEEHQAEPFSDYYSYALGTGIIVDSNWSIDSRYNSGIMMIGLNSSNPYIRGAVFEIWNESKSKIVESENRLRYAFSKNILLARWIRLSEPPKIEKASDLFNFLSKCDNHKSVGNFPIEDGRIHIRAALFPEERAWRQNDKGWGWVFVCEYSKSQFLQKKPRERVVNKQRRKKGKRR